MLGTVLRAAPSFYDIKTHTTADRALISITREDLSRAMGRVRERSVLVYTPGYPGRIDGDMMTLLIELRHSAPNGVRNTSILSD